MEEIIRRECDQARRAKRRLRKVSLVHFKIAKLSLAGIMLSWIFYATAAELIWFSPTSFAHRAGRGPRALSHRQSLRPFRHHDPRPIRDRVPGFRGRQNLGALIRSAISRRTLVSRRAFTRRTSRDSTGISGSLRWAHGRSTRSCPEPKCDCSRTMPMFSIFLRAIPFRTARRARCAP